MSNIENINLTTSMRMPKRPKNKDVRAREFLTEREIDLLMEAAGNIGRHGSRDSALIFIGNRHGFRVSELVGLTWDQIDFDEKLMYVRRLKNGSPSTHPISETEISALRKIACEYNNRYFIFSSERGGQLSTYSVRKMISRAGKISGIPFPVHPHMLRHGCGFKLANDGQDTRAVQHYLGHKNIQHTVRYTELAPDRFKNFWRD